MPGEWVPWINIIIIIIIIIINIIDANSKEMVAHIRTTFPLQNKPITASISFSRTFSRQIIPVILVQSEIVFYLCIVWWEMSQMNKVKLACKRSVDFRGNARAWRSFLRSDRRVPNF